MALPTLCCFGTPDRRVPRFRLLAAGWRNRGGAIIEICEELWPPAGERARLAARPGLWRWGGRWLAAQWRLWQRRAELGPADMLLVTYPGHLDMPLARLLAWYHRKPLIFDPGLSLYDTAVGDRQLFAPKSWHGYACRWLDRLALALADRVLADTAIQADYLATLGHIPRERLAVVPLGADDDHFRSAGGPSVGGEILFYGRMIPLHGVEVVVAAAKLLEDEPGCQFHLVGEGQVPIADLLAHSAPTNVRWTPELPYDDLPAAIDAAAICLGIFGTSDKAVRVVPHKVYEAAAMGKAIVTADTPAIEQSFATEVVRVPAGDPATLAAAIRALLHDPSRRAALGEAARNRFTEAFATPAIGEALEKALAGLLPSPIPPTVWGSDPDFVGPRQAVRQAMLLRRLVAITPAPARVLDAGAGAGSLAWTMALGGYEVIGVDRSEAFVAHASRPPDKPVGCPPRFACADLGSLPFAAGSFEAVVAGEVLEHVVDDARAVIELGRVLVPGGVCVVSVPADPDLWDVSDEWAGHVRRYTENELRSLFESNGFTVLRLYRWGFPFVRLYHRHLYVPLLKRKIARPDTAPTPSPTRWRRLVTHAFTGLLACDHLFDGSPWGIGWVLVARKINVF